MNNIYGIDTDTPEMKRLGELARENNIIVGELRAAITAARRNPSPETEAAVADARRRLRNVKARYSRALAKTQKEN